MDTAAGQNELRVLVAAPNRRDGEITCELLARQDIACLKLTRLHHVAEELPRGVGAIVLTDAARGDPGMGALLEALGQQPPRSDVPVLLLTPDKTESPSGSRWTQGLSNVTVLDRPVSTRAMLSSVEAALRARRRQYQLRDQLIEQQRTDEALRQADRRKDEFLATLAHELRNPLAAIRTGVEVVVRNPDDIPRTHRIVGMIDRQSRMLVKLIDELLDVSRIATGKVVLQKTRLDLRAILEGCLEGGQSAFDASNHEARLDFPSGPVWVIGDATRLSQIVGNLLHNAGKYTPDGGRITLALSQEGTEALIRVIDDGIGIRADQLEQVFDMFTQVGSTLDRTRGGLGIGLSLVRRLVELHGGTVQAQSEGLGRGSTFTVRLPADLATALPGAEPRSGAVASPSPLKVLVVDDNPDIADGLAALLEFDGHHVRTAHDGASALENAEAFAPDIVFCDIGMPHMNGHEVAARLRSDPRRGAMLLVAVTGWGNDDDKRLSLQAGFDMHFTKPLSSEQVGEIFMRYGVHAR